MRPVRQNTVLLASLAVFLTTLLLSQQVGDHRLSLSGLLVVVLLSAFVRGWLPTLLAGVVSMMTMTVLILLLKAPDQSMGSLLLSQLYSLVILALTMGLVLYLKKVQRNFDYEKTHMASLYENATEGILLTDQEGRIILINPAGERMFGYPANEIIGHSVDHLIPQRFQQHHHQLRDQFHASPSNRRMGTGRNLFARRRDGAEFPVEVSLSHYRKGEESYVIAFVVDITQRKQAELELEQQQQELKRVSERIRRLNVELEFKVEERTKGLQDAMEQLERSQAELQLLLDNERELGEIKSRFVSMASHEFRTPLSTILSSATLASKYPKEDQQVAREKHLGRIRESVQHLNRLLEDFLSLGKLEEGKTGILVETFSWKLFLDDLMEEMNLQLQAGQTIRLELSGREEFCTDKRLLKNALLNMLSNAIKFSGPDQVIELHSSDQQKGKCIHVRDHGMGIPASDLPHIFSTFFRASNVTQIQGTGLGLSLVKRYAELLGGWVKLESHHQQGTTVELYIPDARLIDMP